ncbi:MAG: Gfo/Idh/MocA family protein [Verrucomicrobiales bacterium]
MPRKWKIAGVNFDHFHMGDLLRMAGNHPEAEVVGISDERPERMIDAQRNFGLPSARVFTDFRQCLETTKPDLVILCPSTATHAEWVERVAPYRAHLLVEKPFAASIAEADRMIAAATAAGVQLAINWPIRWYPTHALAYQLATVEGRLGDITEVHYYDGNRGPLYHGADKVELEPTPERKAESWFYRKSQGGGSLLDYLGYGTTLGTWYLGGRKPVEVTSMTWGAPGLEVDEHSITIARYEFGLSKFETRWGTFTDPWTHQPQPKCGFVLKGTEGTLSSYDMEDHVRLQTRRCPQGEDISAPPLVAPFLDPIQYFLDCLSRERPVEGPLAPDVARIGQQIVDTAYQSAGAQRSLPLLG